MSYVDRMKKEKEDLDEKIVKARDFLDKWDETGTRYLLLAAQITTMVTYSHILYMRINEEEARNGL